MGSLADATFCAPLAGVARPVGCVAHDSDKAKASNKSQEVATYRAMRHKHEGATVTDISCKEVNYIFGTRFVLAVN